MNIYEKGFNESYKDQNGYYVYTYWDNEEKVYKKEIIRPGENGVTQELINYLAKDDHKAELKQRYDTENLDWKFAAQQLRYSRDSSETANDPINTIIYRKKRTFEDAARSNKQLNKLLEAIQELTPEQIDLVYALYGELKTQTDIARETGKSQQSVYNRKMKIINRLRKLLDEDNT